MIGLLFNGLYFAFEENLFGKYKVYPIYMVIWESFIGLIISMGSIAAFNYVPCPEPDDHFFCNDATYLINI
jgi:hypothetical protein